MITARGKKWYTVTQAALHAGCTVSYVRQLLRKRIISGEKIGERAWIIPVDQLKKLRKSPTGKAGRKRISEKTS